MDEVPEDIEAAFAHTRYRLLPQSGSELNTDCYCPDWANPCKHVAGTYYQVARVMDQDPFLLFQLRGLTRTALRNELTKTPLGQALAARLKADEAPLPSPVAHRFPAAPLAPVNEAMSYQQFFNGARLPEVEPVAEASAVPALIIRREGDAPPFWGRDNSFIEAMSEIYMRVQRKNKGQL